MSNDLLANFSKLVAAVGVLVCLAAGLARLFGSYHLLGYEAMTLFTGGIGLMVFSGLIELHLLRSLLAAGTKGGADR